MTRLTPQDVDGLVSRLETFELGLREIAGLGCRELPAWDRLEALARRARPDEASPLFIPHLAGRVSPPPEGGMGGNPEGIPAK